MASLSDVRALTISDENASDDDRLVTAAQPDTSATMANTTFAGGAARNVIVTTTGTGDNGKTNTIVYIFEKTAYISDSNDLTIALATSPT